VDLFNDTSCIVRNTWNFVFTTMKAVDNVVVKVDGWKKYCIENGREEEISICY
jgi:hypothetical protein